jgi:adenylate cyclase
VSELSVPLESIRACFQGVIPAPLATCSAEGAPNVSYMSIVQYVDPERVALPRQFLKKTRANLDENPWAQVRVVDPETIKEYHLDLQYLYTETEGQSFDAMRANLEAIASQTGMGEVFRLRGVDIYRVVRSEPVGARAAAPARREPERDPIGPLDELTRRLGLCTEYETATRVALQALDDLFGFTQAILLVAGDDGGGLFAVASNGYGVSGAGAEVPVGTGVVGIAAARQRVICVPSLGRNRAMRTAVRESLEQRGEALPSPEIPLPGLESAQSVAAVPLVVRDEVAGVLYLESDRPGRFGPQNERLLRIVGGQIAATLAALEGDRQEEPPAALQTEPTTTQHDAVAVEYYQADDSVFVAGEYVVKGVPGRIFWKLLNEHVADGRTSFTNRELRLDERLGLPPGNDNLEARLLVLRKRLAVLECGFRLDRVGRGRLSLHVDRTPALSEVATSGPMRAAHRVLPSSG